MTQRHSTGPAARYHPSTAAVAGTAQPSAPRFHAPRPSFALMAVLGLVNRWLVLPGRCRVRSLDLPDADRQRLERAVNAGTAAFLAPNHAEFGVDWLLDKEISRRVAPRMAAWAAHEIIAAAPWFWTRNNLVSNRGGSSAIEYSVSWALAGRGVLLHPEGMVRWTADVVHPLFHGAAEMATEAARRAAADERQRPVYLVPLVWKLRYTRDVAAGMRADMATIERELRLPPGDGESVAERFRLLQENVLLKQMERFGFAAAPVRPLDFFERQEAFRAALVNDLRTRYDVGASDSVERLVHRIARSAVGEDDRARAREASRLGGFCRAIYGTPTLTQEQIYESLKRLRADLVRRGPRNVAHNVLPRPYGPRAAHVRVAEPLLVSPDAASGSAAEREAYVIRLLDRTRTSMQEALDGVNRQIAPLVDRFRRPNPFCPNHDR